MKVLFIGPQGSGKGTIGEMISEYSGIPIISSGQTLREIPKDHPWYEEINDQMNKGVLVEQSRVAQLLREKLQQDKYNNGFIMDGWFRAQKDVDLFDPGFDKAVYLNISREETLKRLTSRRTCSKCGDIYNTITLPPKVKGVCDECEGELYQRKDDIPEAINKRLDVFEKETLPIIEMLRKNGILIEVDAMETPQEVFEKVKKVLDLK
ncbi:adenylate kinase family protein [Patescibacteria group bacterium]